VAGELRWAARPAGDRTEWADDGHHRGADHDFHYLAQPRHSEYGAISGRVLLVSGWHHHHRGCVSGWICTFSSGLAAGATGTCNGPIGVLPG
jgi:hypothetical protein